MTSRSRAIILVLAVLGLGFAGASAWVHYKLMTDPTYVSLCDVNAAFNCSQVYMSQYGSVWGVPVALGGLAWFALVAMIAGFARPNDKTSAAGAYIFALATVGLAAILYLAYASFFVLKTGCLLCIGTYISVIGIFLVSGAASAVSVARLPARLPRDLRDAFANPMILLATLVFLVGVTTVVTAFPDEDTRGAATAASISAEAANSFESAWNAQPRIDLGIPADGAKVVVVKFNDYQCPTCRDTHNWYKPVLEKFEQSHPGAVKYVVKDWPWHSKCNFNVSTQMHPAACEASVAVRIAREMNKAEEMEAWIYSQNLGTLTPEAVKAGVEQVLGVTNFDAQYAQRLPDIRRDVADGGALRIQGTPTLFINGVRVDQVMPPDYFEMAINLELKKTDQ
jgi:uncharacterized membrane protein/thiol-disulfide isomerase/thioredoxin